MSAVQRVGREEGWTLVELLVVVVMIGILLGIAVPSYIGYTNRANQKAADADIRSAFASIESLYSDKGTYSSLTLTKIRASYDRGAKFQGHYVPAADNGQTFCVSGKLAGKWAWAQRGKTTLGNGDVQETTPPASCQ